MTTHFVPSEGSALMPCCDRTPFDVPRTDRLTYLASEVTCTHKEPQMDDTSDTSMVAIDGRDALLMVLVKPGSVDGSVIVDAHCNGLDKLQAATILLHVARQWRDESQKAESEQ